MRTLGGSERSRARRETRRTVSGSSRSISRPLFSVERLNHNTATRHSHVTTSPAKIPASASQSIAQGLIRKRKSCAVR